MNRRTTASTNQTYHVMMKSLYVRTKTQKLKKASRSILFCSLVMLGALFLSFSYKPYKELQAVKANHQTLQAEFAELDLKKNQQQRKLLAIREYPEYLEIIARDKLEMYHPDETVIRIKEGAK